MRLYELDALRGLAAMAVVFFHFFYRYDQIYGHHDLISSWAYLGQFGVQLFFIISGYVIFWTLSRSSRAMDFIVSRFSRLYPVFWAALLLTFSIVSIFGLPGLEVETDSAILNTLMFHEYLRVPHVDGVYWTLTVELTFYFLVFVFYIFKQLKHVEVWLFFSVILAVLKNNGVEIPSEIIKILISNHMAFFVSGICFYKLTHEGFSKKVSLVLALSLLSSVTLFSIAMCAFFTVVYFVFYLAVSGRLNCLAAKPLLFLGGISYALYLTHQNIGYVVINAVSMNGGDPLLAIVLAMLVSIAVAYCLTRFVEQPSMNFIRKVYGKLRLKNKPMGLHN